MARQYTTVRKCKNKEEQNTRRYREKQKGVTALRCCPENDKEADMTITNELIYTVLNATCPEDFVKIAKDNDANISIENAKMLFMAIQAAHESKAKHTA